jgi:3-hydroxybutyryl-CoA dehydrogenase
MGCGIAYVSVVAGHEVAIYDAGSDAIPRAQSNIRRMFDSGVTRGRITEESRRAALARLNVSDTLETAVTAVQIVIEAVPEVLELKQRIFGRIAESAPADAILATNTSSLPVETIASATQAVDGAPARVVGMHFFNPVPAMKLVEVVRGAQTSARSISLAQEFVSSIGKTAITVGDSPGFATSRLGVVLGLEAMRMLEQGVATAEDIDRAMELGYNHPVGPLRLTDIVGLDIRLAVADHLRDTLGGETYEAPAILRSLVAQGFLGKKTGRGFYEWKEEAT